MPTPKKETGKQTSADQQQVSANQQEASANQQEASANQQQTPADQQQEATNQEQANQAQAKPGTANQEQETQANAEKDEQDKAPKGEDKKKRPMGMPHGGSGLRLEHEYQVLFGDNGNTQETSAQGQPDAKGKNGAKDPSAQKKEESVTDLKIQLLEKEIALLKEQMSKVQTELQQLKAEKAQVTQSVQEQSAQTQQPVQVDEPDPAQPLLDKLRKLNGGEELSPKVKENLNKIITDAKDGEAVLQQAMNERKPGDPIYGGHYVPNIVAGKQITDIINNAETPDVLTLLSEDGFPARWQEQMKMSPDVRFASDYFHDKEFFRQTLFTKEGSEQIVKSVDQSFGRLADAINAGKENPHETVNLSSKVEAEKLAVEAGLVTVPAEDEEDLLRLLQQANHGKDLPQNVKDNIHKLLTDAEKNRETLKENINAMKESDRAWAGDSTVQSIVAAETLKRVIKERGEPFAGYVGGMDNFMELLGGKDFPKGWKELTGISENVRYAANFEHNKEFFKEHVLEEKGLRQLTDSVSDKFPTYLQKAAAKKGYEVHMQAQSGAFKQEYIADQQAKIKSGQQPYTKPVVGGMQHGAPSIG